MLELRFLGAAAAAAVAAGRPMSKAAYLYTTIAIGTVLEILWYGLSHQCYTAITFLISRHLRI
jgi:predicted secreted protein